MPHFTLSIGPDGPMLDAVVAVSEGRGLSLQAANQPLPSPVKIRALLDTGASCTCVDPSVPAALGLTPTGIAQLTVASGATEPREEFDVSLFIPAKPGDAPMVFRTIKVVATPLKAAQGFDALIGRDILSLCVVTYNGSVNLFTVAY